MAEGEPLTPTDWAAVRGAVTYVTEVAVQVATFAFRAGGATALVAVIGSPEIHALGFWYVLGPATLGPLILLVMALLINNLPRSRRYPEIWF